MPSGDVLTTVTSRAFETAEKLRGIDRIGYPDIELGYDLGDGTVTAESAVIAASKRYIVDVGHADLFNTVVASGDLAEWIVEERSPPDPTALPVQLSPVIYNHLQGPPIPSPPPGSAFTGPPAKT
jgi:hypothetical protein